MTKLDVEAELSAAVKHFWVTRTSQHEQAEIMRREREEAEQEAAARDRQRGDSNYQANQGLSTRGYP